MGLNHDRELEGPRRRADVEVRCINKDCPECGIVAETPVTYELGSGTFDNEDDLTCTVCGSEKEQVD